MSQNVKGMLWISQLKDTVNIKSSNKTEWKNREDIPFYSK